MVAVEEIDRLIGRGCRWMPRWGWHDDHRAAERSPDYLPALMQVRAEFAAFLTVVNALPAFSVLQLGLGPCDASHAVWRAICGHAVTIDLAAMLADGHRFDGASTHTKQARLFAALNGPYDVLFIDAGHRLDDVRADESDYARFVRDGGIVAFHDARVREGYTDDELGVPRHLKASDKALHWIGEEVGIAWYKT